MANWWDAAPVVQPAQNNWWDSAEVVQPAPQQQPEGRGMFRRVDDVVRGAADMLTFGFADEISAGLGSLTGIGGQRGDYEGNVAQQRQRDQEGGWERFGGQVLGGIGGAAGLARAGLSPSVRAIQSGQGTNRVAAASLVEGGLMGAAHGFGSGESLEDRGRGAAIGGTAGGALGAAAPYAIAGASSAIRRAITPNPVSPERVAAARTLRGEGVPVTAGQLTGNRRLRFAESELGGNRTARLMGEQQDNFTSAVLRRAGINANRATPEVIDNAFTRVGKQFDDLAANNTLVPDRDMITALRETFNNYGQTVPESMRAPIVESLTNDIVKAAQRGSISGQAYQNMSSRIARAARGASNPDLKSTLYGIREALDDAMERSMTASNPGQVGAWRQAREQYRNLLAVEQSATRAGEAAAEGIISPANIRNAAINQGRRAYARGQGDFADLARSGSMLLSPLPDSGTAGRLNAQNIGAGITSLLGAGAGSTVAGAPGAMAGMMAGAALPRVAGRALMSRPAQSYLSNQALTSQMTPEMRAAINAILNAQGGGYAGRERPLSGLLPSP